MSNLTKCQRLKLANEVAKWLVDHEMWIDTRIYVNGGILTCEDENGHWDYRNTEDCIYWHDGYDPRDYFEYVNPDHILSMSFEGPLYDVLNWGPWKMEREFRGLFDKYGLYFELGNAWNMTCYAG